MSDAIPRALTAVGLDELAIHLSRFDFLNLVAAGCTRAQIVGVLDARRDDVGRWLDDELAWSDLVERLRADLAVVMSEEVTT